MEQRAGRLLRPGISTLRSKSRAPNRLGIQQWIGLSAGPPHKSIAGGPENGGMPRGGRTLRVVAPFVARFRPLTPHAASRRHTPPRCVTNDAGRSYPIAAVVTRCRLPSMCPVRGAPLSSQSARTRRWHWVRRGCPTPDSERRADAAASDWRQDRQSREGRRHACQYGGGNLLAEAVVPPVPPPAKLAQTASARAAERLPSCRTRNLDALLDPKLSATAKAEAMIKIKSLHQCEAQQPVHPPPAVAAPPQSRVLNGIWATAPYLHNGSVPNLWELFKPARDRRTNFMVGSPVFDPKNVGYDASQSPL